jgi:hypothetical protein
MSYSVDVFHNLRSAYPSWDALQTYLTTPVGGNFRVVGDGRYRILRYVKGVSDLSVPHGKWMRSVVWDTEANLPISVAPPKAEKSDPPTGEGVSYPLVQDYLDGMMINVFRTKEEPHKLQVATRTQIGATGKFYSNKTFAELFQEALFKMRMTNEDVLAALGSNSFASFVLQHPEHRVVARCRSPHLWILHMGSVSETGLITMTESCHTWPIRVQLPSFATRVKEEHACLSDASLTRFFNAMCQQNGWFYQGLVFKDGKGNRWRLRNPNYLYLRSLRGSEATSVERFLRLRSESKVSEYLKHYSEDRETFWDLEQTLRNKTREVFENYCAVHKSHEKKLEDVSWAVRPCVFKLHSHYLEHLRPNNEKVYMTHAVDLVNNLALYEQKRLLTAPATLTPPAGEPTA